MKKYIYFLIPVYALYIFGMFYVMLPPLNWHAPDFGSFWHSVPDRFWYC